MAVAWSRSVADRRPIYRSRVYFKWIVMQFARKKTKHNGRTRDVWEKSPVSDLPRCLLFSLQLWARSWWPTCWYETSWGRSRTPCCWMFRTWPKTRTCSGQSAPKVWARLVWDHHGLQVQLGQGDGRQWRLNHPIYRKISRQSPRMTLTLRHEQTQVVWTWSSGWFSSGDEPGSL